MLFNPTWFRESSQHQVLPHRKSSRERAKLLAKLFYTNLYYFFTLVFENSVVFLLLNRASFYIFKDEESVRISNSLLIFNKCIYIYIYKYCKYIYFSTPHFSASTNLYIMMMLLINVDILGGLNNHLQ